MLSTLEPTPRYLAPHLGDTLLCLRMARLAADCPPPLPRAIFQAAGVEWWPDSADCLIVIWCSAEMVADLRLSLKRYGEAIDWPGRLRLTGHWRALYGVPRIITRLEADEDAEATINIPAWLERVQAAYEHA